MSWLRNLFTRRKSPFTPPPTTGSNMRNYSLPSIPTQSAVRNIFAIRPPISAPLGNRARVSNIFSGNSPLQRNTRKRYNNSVKELNELGATFLEAVVNGDIETVSKCIAINKKVLFINDLNGNSILGIICEEAIRIEKLILPDPTTGHEPSSWGTQNALYDKLKKLLICFGLLLDIINTSKDIDFSSIILKKNRDGNTALLLASSLTTFDRKIYILLSSKCFTDMKTGMINVAPYINTINNANETASYKACKHKNYKLLKYFIYLGADARYGKSCADEFYRITSMRKVKNVKLEKDDSHLEVLMRTARVQYENYEFGLLDPVKVEDIQKEFREYLMPTFNINFYPYLILACEYGIPSMLNPLLEMRPGIVNMRRSDGASALMFSCQRTFPDVDSFYMINTLLEAGANPNFKDTDGNTALINAIEFNQTADVIEALLKKGADINLKNNKGETARIIATKFNRPDIAELLTKPIRRGGRRTQKRKTLRRRRYL
jgi:ankyrin repeat protein